MAFSDSMFLFEIVIEELRPFVPCKDFYINSQFADVFTLNLRNPNELPIKLPKKARKKKIKGKGKGRNANTGPPKRPVPEKRIQTGQSILLTNNTSELMKSMKLYPMELSLLSKRLPYQRLGSTHIPWTNTFIDYLSKVYTKHEPPFVFVKGHYNIFDEVTSRRMALIKLYVKLSHLKDRVTSKFRSLLMDNHQTFMYTDINSKPTQIMSTVRKPELAEGIGTIKTIYKGGTVRLNRNKSNKKKVSLDTTSVENTTIGKPTPSQHNMSVSDLSGINKSLISLIKSDTEIDKHKLTDVVKSKSCSSINQQQINILNYIFGDNGPYGNREYCVGYFTVENDLDKTPSTSAKNTSPTQSEEGEGSKLKGRCKIRICDCNCPNKNKDGASQSSQSLCSLDLPEDVAPILTVTKCKDIRCDHRFREPLPPPDDAIRLDLTSLKNDCCAKVEEVVGGMQAKMQIGEDPCYCSCECKFGFMKRTTYCGVCGGYEQAGEDIARKPGIDMPFPCPVFHKLIDKNKLKTWSTSGSDSKKRIEDSQRNLKTGPKSLASDKKSTEPTAGPGPRTTSGPASGPIPRSTSGPASGPIARSPGGPAGSTFDKSLESEKDSKKLKRKKKDDRFKFNYGYEAPKIGHSKCGLPVTCTNNGSSATGPGSVPVVGFNNPVPKTMGWLWTAEDVPGMKFRPSWKPGAATKHVVRLLKIAKNPGEVIAKKRRKDTGKKKRPLVRPLVVVHKKDGEFTVTMETMKQYSKPRTLNQQPYEDKEPITFTIGRTEEENRERQKKKDRVARRLERAQRDFIQSAFKDMCKEICLKTYQQALGFLPDTEDPDCPCYPALPCPDRTNMDVSCSCSEDSSTLGSVTDSDEWIVEFTPPVAKFDPTFKGKKVVKVDNSSQYTYLDYRVKLLDRYGNPVVRFFKGPDGKQQCSDLGGFWSPDHTWLEINNDGYIAPDGRWAPNSFIGPSGEQVDAEAGKFQASNGKWYVVGVDGFVDAQGKWRFYSKPRGVPNKSTPSPKKVTGAGDKKDAKIALNNKPSEATWSCFGDATPKQLSQMGIVGHGQDRKLLQSALKNMIALGEDVRIPAPTTIPRMSGGPKKGQSQKSRMFGTDAYMDENICKHSLPSNKGIVAVDSHGRKTYFRMKDNRNRRPQDRMRNLTDQGISLSAFHLPCFHSFINTELMKKEQLDRLMAMSTKCVSTQVSQGWRPGAISKRLLRMLNKAKRQVHEVQETKPARKLKKRVEEKPTLIVSKVNGEFYVEMQGNSVNTDGTMENCSPLVYKIAREDNPERVKHKEWVRRRMIRKAVKEVWSDPYHPQVCQKTCLKAYKQAVGLLPFDPNNPDVTCEEEFEEESLESCSCHDEEISSDCSSLDLDWEIHFSPPIAYQL